MIFPSFSTLAILKSIRKPRETGLVRTSVLRVALIAIMVACSASYTVSAQAQVETSPIEPVETSESATPELLKSIRTPRQAGVDQRLGFGARTVPFGAALYGELGYNQPIWGSWEDPENFNFGFVRPALEGSTSITVSKLGLELAVYPISFFGLAVGHSYSYTATNKFAFVDCEVVACQGLVAESYGLATLLLAYRSVVFSGEYRMSVYQPDRTDRDVFLSGPALVLGRETDRLRTLTATIGFRLADFEWGREPFVGVNFSRTDVEARENASASFTERLVLTGGHKRGRLRFIYGAGIYDSSLTGTSPLILGLVEWVGGPANLSLN